MIVTRRHKRMSQTGLMLICLLLCIDAATSATRGISVSVRQSEERDAPVTGQVELYQSSYALVIGNDAYHNGWPPLSNAIKDAELVAAVLEEKGFEVELHRNLSSKDLNTIFKRFFILKGEDPESRLFIWYAGHGATVDGEGYLIPVDAPVPSVGGEFKFASSALRDFGTYMRQARSKHAYAVFDSCFAGTVFSAQRDLPSAAITLATTLPVRQFLTSGDADQTVSDDGTFREMFIRAIKGEERSDSNSDGYLTATEIGMFLGDRITNLTQSLQTPRYGKLRDKDFDRGDFVFRLPQGAMANQLNQLAPSGRTTDAPSNAAEIAFWNSLKDSDDPAEFDAYINTYPGGSFVSLANVKKQQLLNEISKPRKQPAKPVASSGQYSLVFLDEDFEATRDANVRENPFRGAPRVAQLQRGDRVWVIGEARTNTATWYRVARDGAELGFVYSELLRQYVRPASEVENDSTLGDEVFASRGFENESVVIEPADETTTIASMGTDVSETGGAADNQWSALEMMLEKEHEAQSRLPPRIRRVVQRANEGDVTSQAQLAYLYHVGEEMPVDLEQAAHWYEKAAEGGDARAQVNLALMLESGEGVPVNSTTAIRWLREAADQFNADAQQLLGYHYETGKSVELDYAQAIAFYTAAAQQGKPVAQHNLARMYQLGLGTEVDMTRARYWYGEAAEQGFEEASRKLAQLSD